VTPFRGGIQCEQCREGLGSFIEEVLQENEVPRDSPILQHLEGCPRCSETYIQLIDLMTAPQIQDLEDSQTDPSRVPGNLGGLLLLWQIQLAACTRLEDLRGCAVGLSIVGMIRRSLGDPEEARLVHELALETAAEGGDLLSRVVSNTDLAAMALHSGRGAEALEHLTRAQQYAAQISDRESEARILVLMGDMWKEQGNLGEARRRYEEAERLLSSRGERLVSAEIVRRRIHSVSPPTADRPSCPAPDRLVAYQRGELQGGQKLLVAQHLRMCADCARKLAALAREERLGLADRVRAAIKMLDAGLLSPQLQASGLRGDERAGRPGPSVYRAGEIEVILNQAPSRTPPLGLELSGLIHVGGQVTAMAGEARVELYRGEGLIDIAHTTARGEFAFSALEPGIYDLSLIWSDREIHLKGVEVR
jgi:tetratricopeptide (TPR) repeat protein